MTDGSFRWFAAFANTELLYMVLATLVGLAFVYCYKKGAFAKVSPLPTNKSKASV